MENINELSSCLSSEEFSSQIDLVLSELNKREGRSKIVFHSHACRVVSELSSKNKWAWFSVDGPQTDLLQALGPKNALEVIGASLPSSRLLRASRIGGMYLNCFFFPPLLRSSSGAEWLEKEVISMMRKKQFENAIWEECAPPTNPSNGGLTIQQNMLLKTLSRLPDLVAGKRGRKLNPALYPNVYYKNLANVIQWCLKKVVDSIRGKLISL